jgi:hypothetical protein
MENNTIYCEIEERTFLVYIYILQIQQCSVNELNINTVIRSVYMYHIVET